VTLPRPQRIFPHAAPGSLLKRVSIPAQSAPRKSDADQDPGYLALIRECPCLHCGMEPSEPAHLRMSSAAYGKASGLGKKPADRWANPLCSEHHRLARDAQHNRGEQEFWHALGINPLITATLLYEQRGDLPAMRAIVFMTIAQRSIAR
jgi:hypothetical protein